MISGENHFKPPWWLKNPHLQTVLASMGPRRRIVRKSAANFIAQSRCRVLLTDDAVKLQVWQTPPSTKGQVILLHGWEGSSDSLYMLSLGSRLFQAGYQVTRINFRDHGDTFHLNRQPFTSTRHHEIADACKQLCNESDEHDNHYLAGFSLGGNFALRLAADAASEQLRLRKVIAVSPLIHPPNTVNTLSESTIYGRYFTNRWKSSVRRKLALFPELTALEAVLEGSNLNEMHQHFAPHFSDYPDCARYLQAYSLLGERLCALSVDSVIISSKDDPIIDYRDLDQLPSSHKLHIERIDCGGHCGFLKNHRLESWIDERVCSIIENTTRSAMAG